MTNQSSPFIWATRPEAEFAEIVFADEQWLRAEFDDIIAAEWPDPTPPPQAGSRPHPHSRRMRPRIAPTRSIRGRTRRLGTEAQSRERSPPTPSPLAHRHESR